MNFTTYKPLPSPNMSMCTDLFRRTAQLIVFLEVLNSTDFIKICSSLSRHILSQRGRFTVVLLNIRFTVSVLLKYLSEIIYFSCLCSVIGLARYVVYDD